MRSAIHGRALRPGIVFWVTVVAIASACGDADADAEGAAGGEGGASAAGGGAGGTVADTYVAGLKRMGADGHLAVVLEDAVPAPPQRGLNDWRVRVEDAAGAAQADCTLEVGLYMPLHGHSSTTRPTVAPGDTAGAYTLTGLNLFMPGLWEITLTPTCGALTDQALFVFEIAR